MHTKEPWVVGESMQFGVFHVSVDETCEFAPRSLALTGVIGDLDHEESVANARRIVACVNACAGIPTEDLEASPNMGLFHLAEFANETVIQRDELLAALKEVMAAHRAYPKRFTDDVQKLEGIMERQRKACIAADEIIAKCES